jgi:hypothetical protein
MSPKKSSKQQSLFKSERTHIIDSITNLDSRYLRNLNYYNQLCSIYSQILKSFDFGMARYTYEDRAEYVGVMGKSYETGRDLVLEHRIRRSDGEFRWYLSRAIAQRAIWKAEFRWVGTTTDIHDQRVSGRRTRKTCIGKNGATVSRILNWKSNRELQTFACFLARFTGTAAQNTNIRLTVGWKKNFGNLSPKGIVYHGCKSLLNGCTVQWFIVIFQVHWFRKEKRFYQNKCFRYCNEIKEDLWRVTPKTRQLLKSCTPAI